MTIVPKFSMRVELKQITSLWNLIASTPMKYEKLFFPQYNIDKVHFFGVKLSDKEKNYVTNFMKTRLKSFIELYICLFLEKNTFFCLNSM